jgi:dTDP-4-dehydrorhamnose 3,5-epimerase
VATDPEDESPTLASVYSVARFLTVHPDERGNVRETYRATWFPATPQIRQLVRSESLPQTLRGMHLHRKQWDLWHFVSGAAVVRLRYADGSEFFGRYDAGSTLAIPPGVAHGFYTEEGCVLLYALTEEYDGSDEFGFFPLDGVTEDSHPAWPRSHIGIRISERDLRAVRLAEFGAWL